MSEQIIKLPFFNEKKDSVRYLSDFEYLPIKNKGLNNNLKNKIFIDEGIFIQKRPIKKGVKINKRILVIEPHPDDFALSASGYVLDALSKGASVTVLNIFSKTSVSKFPWRNEIHISNEQYEKLRIDESVIAVEKYLEEKFESLRLPTPTLDGKFKTFPKKYAQTKLINYITKKIIKKIKNKRINTVLCPMAIRGHLAHLIAFDATIAAFKSKKQQATLILYEDMPYARSKIAYFERLQYLKKLISIEDFYIDTKKYLETIADLIIIYRSQFDDINRNQMLAIIKEDFRATAAEHKANNKKEFLQRYFKVKKINGQCYTSSKG